MDSPYRDARQASSDITLLNSIKVDAEDFIERIESTCNSLHHPDANKAASDFINGLRDLLSDDLFPLLRDAQEHVEQAAARVEREHIRRAKVA